MARVRLRGLGFKRHVRTGLPNRSRALRARSSGVSARSAPQLGGERHRTGAATGTAHRHQDVLLLILFEIGAVEYLPRLLLKQLMQRKARGHELVLDRQIALRHVAL